jgi:PAS domain S-box-containing protein
LSDSRSAHEGAPVPGAATATTSRSWIRRLPIIRNVTGRRRSEEALRESEERFRSAFEHAAIGVALVALDGRLLQVNRSCCGALGYSEQELTSTTWQALTHQEDLDITQDSVRRVLAGERDSFQLEKRFVHKDGHVLWGHVTSSLVRDADGRPLYFVTQIEDITERKRADKALRESEEKYRNLVETARDVIYTLSTDGTFLTLNHAFETITGWTRAGWLGKPFARLLHADDLSSATENFRRILRGEMPPASEIRVLARSGEYLTGEFAARPLIEDGKIVGTFGIVRDITERKRAEEALRESEERFRSTLDGMLEGCQIIGFDWRYLYVNDATARHGRRTKEELLGHTMKEIYPGIEDTEVFAHLQRCMEERVPHQMENEFTYPDGERAWFKLSVQPVTEGIFVLSLDITERKRAEEALRETREELETRTERQLLQRNPYGLTFREHTVLHLVAAGESDRQIGTTLGISPLTAQKHVSNILAKMDASSRTEAGVRAVREGLIE